MGIEPFNFSFFRVTGWGIDLDYCDIEWDCVAATKMGISEEGAGEHLGNSAINWDFPSASVVKNLTTSAVDVDWIPGSERCPPGSGEGNDKHSNVLSWEIPWTEKPGRLQSMGSQRVGLDLVTEQP